MKEVGRWGMRLHLGDGLISGVMRFESFELLDVIDQWEGCISKGYL